MNDEKQCFKCLNTYSLDEFYKHPEMPDGHLNKCKKCTRLDTKANREKNIEYYTNCDKERNSLPHRIKMREDYRDSSRESDPQRYLARQKAERAFASGKIVKRPCHSCGSDENLEMHREDYSKPLDIIWFCVKCHRKLDSVKNKKDE
jgi:hypothetical protein